MGHSNSYVHPWTVYLALIPKIFWYIIAGLFITAGVIAYLIYRKYGFELLKTAWRQVYRLFTTGTRREITTLAQLPSSEAYRIKGAVGNKCESTNCRNPRYPNLDVHHTIPRHEDNSSHKLNNLLVLCPACHRFANHNMLPRQIQRQLATRPNRFSRPDLVEDWPYK